MLSKLNEFCKLWCTSSVVCSRRSVSATWIIFAQAREGNQVTCVSAPRNKVFTLKIVSSSSCCGVCRVACFHGILKRIASRSIHSSPGYRPLSTCATSHGLRRTRRGVTDILPARKQHTRHSKAGLTKFLQVQSLWSYVENIK